MPQRPLAGWIIVVMLLCVGMGCESLPEKEVGSELQVENLPTGPVVLKACPSIGERFIFELGSETPSRDAIEKLILIAAELRKWPLDLVSLFGHTCDLGDSDFNMALGLKRAEAIERVLVSLGVDSRRITTRSWGELRPAFPNDSPQNRRWNRRVELELTPRE